MADQEQPTEVTIVREFITEGGVVRASTYRGWICPNCSAVVADLDHHNRALHD